VGGSTMVPLVQERVAALFGKRPQGNIDPMEVVALGAAAHAQALFAPETIKRAEPPDDADEGAATGVFEKVPAIALLLDVTSHAVGLGTAGGFAEVLLEKNTPIPAEVSKLFSTAKDDQESVVLKVCQGADTRYKNNEALGELRLDGLRKGPRGQVRIEVGFLVDADGMLQVSARDPDTGVETSAALSLFGIGDEG